MDISKIGKKIRAIRSANNLNLKTVAERVGMSVTGYGNIERGDNADLSLNRLVIISKVLDVSMFEILPLEEEPFVSKTMHESAVEGYKLCIDHKDKEIEYLQRKVDECQSRLEQYKHNK